MKKIIFAGMIVFSLFIGIPLVSAGSLHDLKSEWLDQNGEKFQLSGFRGSKVIIGMIYTSCPHACPMTISKVKEIERAIKKHVNYKVILASFDVKNDKPENLKKQVESRKLDQKVWKLLSAKTDEQARELALVLGISYKELEDGGFSHSNAITLLNENGEVVSRLEGLNSDATDFLKVMNEKN